MFPDKSLTINQGTAKCCAYFVGGKMTHKEKEERNTEIVQLRHEGQSMTQIAERYGISDSAVSIVCKKYGVAGVMSDRKPSVYRNGKYASEDTARKYISRYDSFEYVGNYTGIDGYADIRCKTCGTVQKKSMVTIRKYRNLICYVCRQREAEKRKTELEEKRREAKEQRQSKQHTKHIYFKKQFEMKQCACCGGMFITTNSRTRVCSSECSAKLGNAIGKDRRIKKMRSLIVDRDITLEKLFKRDNGVCYICGRKCNSDDYYINSNGTFIAGAEYPSIDHVKPLSKGGKHEWANVKLAHRRCNWEKRDVYISP